MRTATVTDQQIRALRAEAARAGDWRQVDVCDVALGIRPQHTATDRGSIKDSSGRSMTRTKARSACSKVISYAQGEAGHGGAPSRHHATKKKSSAQLNREIAEVLGSWEEDPFGGYRFITTSEGVRFDTAGVDPTYYRDTKWRQRWEFDLKREIEKFKAGKPTKLYKMSETHYRLPGTV